MISTTKEHVSSISIIDDLDLSLVKMKLMDSEEGLNWTYNHCEEAEIEYKRFLTLLYLYPNESIVPTKQMDKFWHFHILDTWKYYNDCQNIFGKFIHHYPYLGMFGKEDEEKLNDCFMKTSKLYENTFGEKIIRQASSCNGHGYGGGGRCGRL